MYKTFFNIIDIVYMFKYIIYISHFGENSLQAIYGNEHFASISSLPHVNIFTITPMVFSMQAIIRRSKLYYSLKCCIRRVTLFYPHYCRISLLGFALALESNIANIIMQWKSALFAVKGEEDCVSSYRNDDLALSLRPGNWFNYCVRHMLGSKPAV